MTVNETLAKCYWREADARAALAAWRRSGKTLAGFAADAGCGPGRLRRWARRLDFETATGPSVDFLKVQVTPPRVVRHVLDVRVGGCVVQVEPGFDAQLLRDVADALGGHTC